MTWLLLFVYLSEPSTTSSIDVIVKIGPIMKLAEAVTTPWEPILGVLHTSLLNVCLKVGSPLCLSIFIQKHLVLMAFERCCCAELLATGATLENFVNDTVDWN